jgi:hypothetical protein
VAGIDGTGQRLAQPGNPPSDGLVFVVDLGDGCLLEVGLLDEDDADAVKALIKDLQANYRIGLWVSDEHNSYSQAIEKHRHLLCTAHFKRNKLHRIEGLKGQARSEQLKRDLQELEELLREPPPDGRKRAGQISCRRQQARRPQKGERATAASKLKQLAGEVYEKGDRVWEQTNNATERAIGLCLKIRSKLMREFKVTDHLTGFAGLRGWMNEQGESVELGWLL